MLVQPFSDRLPSTQAQYGHMVNQLRSMGHILDRCRSDGVPRTGYVNLCPSSPGSSMKSLNPVSQHTSMTELVNTIGQLIETTNNDPQRYAGTAGERGNAPPTSRSSGMTQWSYKCNKYDNSTDSDTASSWGNQDYDEQSPQDGCLPQGRGFYTFRDMPTLPEGQQQPELSCTQTLLTHIQIRSVHSQTPSTQTPMHSTPTQTQLPPTQVPLLSMLAPLRTTLPILHYMPTL